MTCDVAEMRTTSTQVHQILDFFKNPLPKQNDILDTTETSVDELYALCDDPMQAPAKLVSDKLHFADLNALQDLFVENSGFLVVGVVGLQGTGKSTLLNVLANHLSNESELFDGPFGVQSMRNIITNSPRTGGIDLYITQDRLILLDVQPLLSFALMNYHIQSAQSSTTSTGLDTTTGPGDTRSAHSLTGPGGWSMDVWAEMTSLQITSFLLNVCHVVLVVSDELSTAPSQLHALIDRAASLKPTVYTPSVLPAREHAFQCDGNTEKQPARGVESSSVKPNRTGSIQVDRTRPVPTNSDETRGIVTATVNNIVVSDQEARNDGQSVDDEEEEEEEDSVALHRLPMNRLPSSGELPVSVDPDGVLTERGRSGRTGPREFESSDVMDALNRLRGLTDYCASLIHVYNQAPAAAYLNPVISDLVRMFHQRLLPNLYPGHRRLAAQLTCTPQLLTAHLHRRAAAQTSVTQPRQPQKELSEVDGAPGLAVVRAAISSTRDTDASDAAKQPDVRGTDAGTDSSSLGLYPTGLSMQPSDKPATSASTSSPMEESGPTHIGTRSTSPPSQAAAEDEVVDGTTAQRDLANEDGLESETVAVRSTPSMSSLQQMVEQTDSKSDSKSRGNSKSRVQHGSNVPEASPDHPSGPSESEIVAECCSVVQSVQKELDSLLTQGASLKRSDNDACRGGLENGLDATLATGDGAEWNGEQLHASMAHLTHQVQSSRRDFFNVQRRLSNPRLFLIPELDEEGRSPVGCPTYGASIQELQEAILSTPRQHMLPQLTERKWLAYAQKMWDAVCSSPILQDYHSILLD